jgi:hypothetical protein
VIAGERPPWTLNILFSISADKLKKKTDRATYRFHISNLMKDGIAWIKRSIKRRLP